MIFRLRIALALAVLVVTLLYCAAAWLLTRSTMHVRRVFSWSMARPVPAIARLRIRVTGEEHLAAPGPGQPTDPGRAPTFVVAANQQSLLCYPILSNVYRRFRDAVMVARLVREWHLPIGSWLWVKTGNIMVDPANPIRSAIGLKTGLAALERGTSVWIFPEGTRWKVPGELGPFKRGAFMLAIDAGVPILPVLVSPLKPRTDLAAGRLLPNDVEVRILPPIATRGLTRDDLPRLRDQVREVMQQALDDMARERGLLRKGAEEGVA